MTNADDRHILRSLGIAPPGKMVLVFRDGKFDAIEDRAKEPREWVIAGTATMICDGMPLGVVRAVSITLTQAEGGKDRRE